ncbi:MAG: acyltransferase [Brevundimonas sp.]|nr:MAG: acyltransferase [Brevundimonas sp.]
MFSPARSSAPIAPNARGGALDALRFVAAMFVVVFHFGDEAPIALVSMHDFLGRGYLATDFFLMLSGFVLAKAYGAAVVSGKVSLGRFWSKRFVRCYPTHIITLAMLVAMIGVGLMLGIHSSEPHRYDFSGLPAQILLLHAFGIGAGQWNMPSWTISALLICYAFFPMLWARMLRLAQPASALAVGLIIIVLSDLISLRLLGVEQFAIGFQWTFFRAAPLFLVGLTLARAVQSANWSAAQARTLGFTGGAVLLVNALFAGPDLFSILAICAIIMGCGASPVTRALPGAAWGAKVSFSLFMVHTITGALWFDGIEPLLARLHPAVESVSWEAWAMWAGSLAFTVAAAAAYCRWVDEPIVAWLNKRLFTRPEVAVSARPDPRPVAEPSA